MFKNSSFQKLILYCTLILFILNFPVFGCDPTPSLIPGNVIDNGDGTYYMDISACIGSGGSEDGFDLYFNNDINIIGTTVTEIVAPGTGNVATVSVNNGIWLATYNGANYFENNYPTDCIDFGIIVDDNPEGGTICSLGINEDCLGWTQNDEFITCGVVPGPCLPNYFITDNGSVDSDVIPAGQNCNFAPFNDEIIELTVSCDGNFNFSLTQDQSMNWGAESWLTIAAGCCSGVIAQTSSFGFIDPTITINDTYLTEGIYYIIVDIYTDAFTPGDYILDVTSDADVTLVSTADAGQDQNICDEATSLNANTPAVNNELGTWSVISGGGTFTNPSDPFTTVSNLNNGINIFQWEISNDCVSSSDQVTITVSNDIELNIPETVYCLEQIPLLVSGGDNSGEWSVEPNFNVTIDNPNSNNTFAIIEAYGDYTFTYSICGENFSSTTSMQSLEPSIETPSNIYFCLEDFQLNAIVNGDPGYWDYEGPYIANFNNITSLSPIITLEGYGTYTFTYYGCGTSTDIIINMEGEEPSIEGPDEIFCLQTFDVSAQVNGDPGYWSAEGPGNITFDNPNTLNTTVTLDEYGTYILTYNGCGLNNSIVVNALEANPQITQPTVDNLIINCNLSTNLEAIVLGDPGYWSVEGPGNVTFSNQNNLNTSVVVDEYGSYDFTYYGCGTTSQPVTINFNSIEPQIITENNIFCQLTTQISAITEDITPVQWFHNNPNNNTTVSFSNPNSVTTDINVSEYGIYEIGLSSCGNTVFTEIHFQPVAPYIIAPSFQNCVLNTTLIAYTDDPIGGGPWTQTGGTPGAVFNSPNSTLTEVTVPEFGVYEFTYAGCDSTASILIGFECPLVIPNTLTPNDDGNNDLFIIQNLNPAIYSKSNFTVYNRWGIVIYNATEYGFNNIWWDGKKTFENEIVNDGVYFYVLEVFNSLNQQWEEYTGQINIFISNSSSSNEDFKNDEFNQIPNK